MPPFELLEAAGCEVIVPETPDLLRPAGLQLAATAPRPRALAKKLIAEFEGYEYVVAPSGSCADQIRTEYPGLLADDPEWHGRAVALASRVYELTDFLVNVAKIDKRARAISPAASPITIPAPACAAWASRHQPRALLAKLPASSCRK